MYVFINHRAIALSTASIILDIDAQELIKAGHTVNSPTEPSPFNYTSVAECIGNSFEEIMDELYN